MCQDPTTTITRAEDGEQTDGAGLESGRQLGSDRRLLAVRLTPLRVICGPAAVRGFFFFSFPSFLLLFQRGLPQSSIFILVIGREQALSGRTEDACEDVTHLPRLRDQMEVVKSEALGHTAPTKALGSIKMACSSGRTLGSVMHLHYVAL